jgi:hypothetical protein
MLQTVDARDVPAVAQQLLAAHGGVLRHVFQSASTGFSVQMTELQATALARDANVAFVEEVAIAHLSSDQPLPGDGTLYHLDRIDGVRDNHYYYCEKGSSVTAYVIGSGVWRDHDEFRRDDGSSRVLRGVKITDVTGDDWIAPGDSVDYGYWPCGATFHTNDGYHDTATASMLGGKTYGVAKAVNIVPLRVISCYGYGTSEWASWAIDWIMSSNNPYRSARPAVVSMSFFFFTTDCSPNGGQPAVDASYLENEIDKLLGYDYAPSTGCTWPHIVKETGQPDYTWYGIPVVVSANNQSTDQSDTSPARMAFTNQSNFGSCSNVISVGGINESDARWTCGTPEACATTPLKCGGSTTTPGSNYGPTVDIYAGAHKLMLASPTCTTCTVSGDSLRSGTSFAAPIVAGVIARMQADLGTLSPETAWTILNSTGVLPGSAIEPSGVNNKKIVHRDAQATCSPEYP